MPVNLLGIMAIAMFYIITVVVGLCANRCLAHEDDADLDQGGGDGDKKEEESQLELVKLIESLQRGVETQRSPPQITLTHEDTPSSSAAPNYRELDPTALNSRNLLRPPSSDLDSAEYSSAGSGRRWSQQHRSLMSPRLRRAAMLQADAISEAGGSSVSTLPERLPPAGKYLLAEKNIGMILGSLSILAVRTGGIFSNSVAQEIYEQGLLWCHVPVASSLSLIIGGALFASNLYSEQGYVTILDPFQDVYGVRVGAIFFIPILIADLLFAAIVLSSLGALIHITLDVSEMFGIVASLVSIFLYLLAGGLYAGTLTDAAQFLYLCFGLWLVFPFVLKNNETASVTTSFPSWLGKVDGRHSGIYIDQIAVLVLGGIPVQSYFQRIFSSKSRRTVRVITLAGSFGCLINAIPALMVGAAATSTDWANTTFGMVPAGENVTIILPIAIRHMVPGAVMFVVLGALASGLLASCDSALFGLATIISQNLYRNWFRPDATEKELIWLARMAVVVVSLLTLLLCLAWPRWHHYWILPYDVLYVLIFPQLFCVVYFRYANTYGAIAGLIVGGVLRVSFGESKISLRALVPLPFWDAKEGQLFPYRTLAMLGNLLTLISVSVLYHWLWKKGKLASVNDVFLCFSDDEAKRAAARRTARFWRRPESDSSFLDLRQFQLRARSLTRLPDALPASAAVERMTVL